jgi:hypothetical protein
VVTRSLLILCVIPLEDQDVVNIERGGIAGYWLVDIGKCEFCITMLSATERSDHPSAQLVCVLEYWWLDWSAVVL